jgi:Putative lumazine-binding
MPEHTDQQAIRAVILNYLEGMIWDGDAKLRGAMHELCMQAGHVGGRYEFIPRDAFIAEIGKLERLPTGTAFDWTIDFIDITGDAAIAKVTDTCFGSTWTDYLTFIKHDGEWQMVMKVFYEHPATP